MSMTFGGSSLLDARTEADNLARIGIPAPDHFAQANSLLNPLGCSPARGWLLMFRADANRLVTVGTSANLVLNDGKNTPLTLYGLVPIASRAVTPGMTANALDSCHLVEVADSRWMVHNPRFSIPVNAQYNVRDPIGSGSYYATSTNASVTWTWSTLVGDLWGLMSTQLGTYPGLPFTPDGTPEGWKFPGVPAWLALCAVLDRIGCAVRCNLSASSGQYTIVQVGATDAAWAAQEAILKPQRMYDAEYIEGTRGRLPYGVRVFFHKFRPAGTAETTQITAAQWTTGQVTNVDIVGPVSATAEAGIYHPIWDDLPALYDATGTATNAAALTTRAQERADDFYRRMRSTGGERLHRTYRGFRPIQPGASIKGVAWRQVAELGHHDTQGGYVTEVVRHPWKSLAANDSGRWCELEDSSAIQPPCLAPTWPDYPVPIQVIEIANGTPSSGRYDSTVEQYDPVGNTWTDKESCYVIDLAGSTSLTAGDRYLARLEGYANSRPTYAIRSAVAAAGGGYATIQEEGTGLAQQVTLNFIGAAITAADDAGNSRTNVTLGQSPSTSTSVVGVDRTITAGTGLSGGGDLSANRTFSLAATISGDYTLSGTITVGTALYATPIYGSASASGTLTIHGTSHATHGYVLIDYLAGGTGSAGNLVLAGTTHATPGYVVADQIAGSTASGGDISIASTTHATKGRVKIGSTSVLQIGTTAPGTPAAGDIWSASGALTWGASSKVVESQDNKNAASGYCPLDSGVLVPVANLPSSVKEVSPTGFRHTGSSPLSLYYPSGEIASAGHTNMSPATAKLYALPFMSAGNTMSSLTIQVNTAAFSGTPKCRVGIYTATASGAGGNRYPSALLTDYGELTLTTTGAKTATGTDVLAAGTLYYFAVNFNSDAISGSYTGISVTNAFGMMLLGYQDITQTGLPVVGWRTGQTYGAMPSTYPAYTGTTDLLLGGPAQLIPAIFALFSA